MRSQAGSSPMAPRPARSRCAGSRADPKMWRWRCAGARRRTPRRRSALPARPPRQVCVSRQPRAPASPPDCPRHRSAPPHERADPRSHESQRRHRRSKDRRLRRARQRLAASARCRSSNPESRTAAATARAACAGCRTLQAGRTETGLDPPTRELSGRPQRAVAREGCVPAPAPRSRRLAPQCSPTARAGSLPGRREIVRVPLAGQQFVGRVDLPYAPNRVRRDHVLEHHGVARLGLTAQTT